MIVQYVVHASEDKMQDQELSDPTGTYVRELSTKDEP
jgi:hypothetical protein